MTSLPEQNSLIEIAINQFNEFEAPAAVQIILNSVITAVVGTVKYRFIDKHGPNLKFGTVPLVDR